ncbi:HNH endonuclease [Enteractinococcus coprophilus]|uniref:HNH endonuclease n=1 Tax=Enteractinococcus coprophilus TaxID=1027633 RepID=A0A543AFJ7_9MICC|nr:DUF222 domain-containing protein [Enteractinococcus coprophilus]TQL71357.1 HNH endonuclease [Enteractinococcus coprophilus]
MTISSSTDMAPVKAFADWLDSLPPASTQEDSIERIRIWEELVGKVHAKEATEAAHLEQERIVEEQAQKVPKADRGKGLGAEIGLARRESHARGKKFLNTARALHQDMPYMLAAMSAGLIKTEHAHNVVKETEVLSSQHRRQVDRALKDRFGSTGPRELANEARAHAQRLDPKAAASRHSKAKDARRVTCQPAGDGMALWTAYGPAPALTSLYNGLHAKAKSLVSAGKSKDEHGVRRTRDQVMFDLFTQWGSGEGSVAAGTVDLMVPMTPDALLAKGDTPAWLAGHGPIPASVAREWLANEQLKVFIRRLFSDATATRLVSMEFTGRSFPANIRKMLLLRDNTCRSPYCEAPILDGDHITPHRNGGATNWENASGLCGACNQTKENRGWQHEGNAHSLTVTTPTGHTYTKNPGPLLPGHEPEAPAPPDETPPRHTTRPIGITRSPYRQPRRLSITQYLRC